MNLLSARPFCIVVQSTAFAGYYFIFVIKCQHSLGGSVCMSWFSLLLMLIFSCLLITDKKEEKHGKISQHDISFKFFDFLLSN